MEPEQYTISSLVLIVFGIASENCSLGLMVWLVDQERGGGAPQRQSSPLERWGVKWTNEGSLV